MMALILFVLGAIWFAFGIQALLDQLKQILMKLSEALTVLSGVDAHLDEAKTEIVAELEKLRNTDPDLSPEGTAIVEGVKAKAQGLADIVPNAPTEPPAT